MLANWYKSHGFEVSLLTEQATIDRAEADVKAAYLEPIVGANIDTPEAIDALANLTFLLLLQRTIFATRAGAKIKQTAQSQEAGEWQKISQQASVCHLKLQALRESEGANKTARVFDICKIYFSTNFYTI